MSDPTPEEIERDLARIAPQLEATADRCADAGDVQVAAVLRTVAAVEDVNAMSAAVWVRMEAMPPDARERVCCALEIVAGIVAELELDTSAYQESAARLHEMAHQLRTVFPTEDAARYVSARYN